MARLGPRPKTSVVIRALGADCWKKFGRLRLAAKTGLSAELLGPRPKTSVVIRALGADCWKKFGRLRLAAKTGLSAELLGPRPKTSVVIRALGADCWKKFGRLRLAAKTGLSAELLAPERASASHRLSRPAGALVRMREPKLPNFRRRFVRLSQRSALRLRLRRLRLLCLDRNVTHGRRAWRAVPVVFTGRNEHHVARADRALFGRGGYHASALGHDQDLIGRVLVELV